MKDIIEKFDISGDIVNTETFGNGNINDTYLVTFSQSGKFTKYILQRINTFVFKDADVLMRNVAAVTSYLRGKSVNTLEFIPLKGQNRYFFKDSDGRCWRIMKYVDSSVAYDKISDSALFESCAEAFGKFQMALRDFPAESLGITIPDFHNTKKYIEKLENSLKGKNLDSDLCDTLNSLLSYCDEVFKETENMNFPLRVVHNDTKCNNVLFDKSSGECICVIDLDTVMPGYCMCDFGDAIRSGANPAGESERDLSKVYLDTDLFFAFASGYLKYMKDVLTADEIKSLPLYIFLMCFECGVRFLTDYLNGNVYFKTNYEEENLHRALVQFKLAEDVIEKMEYLKRTINGICER